MVDAAAMPAKGWNIAGTSSTGASGDQAGDVTAAAARRHPLHGCVIGAAAPGAWHTRAPGRAAARRVARGRALPPQARIREPFASNSGWRRSCAGLRSPRISISHPASCSARSAGT